MQHKRAEYFKAIEDYINDYNDRTGSTPSVREIAEGVGLAKSSVSRYLSEMRENGDITFDGHRSIVTKQMQHDIRSMSRGALLTKSPVVGSIVCGEPTFAEESIDEYVKLPVSIFGNGPLFILRASGDSMIDIGIEDGDLVVVRQQSTADPGDVVVALVDDKTTLKRYYPEPERRRIRLHPENSEMTDIIVKSCVIQGVAVNVIKDII